MNKIDKKLLLSFDFFSFFIIFLLFLVGLLFITNATMNPLTGDEATLMAKLAMIDPTYPSLHILWFCLGVAAILFVCLFDYHIYADFAKIAYVAIVALLGLLLLLGVATRGTIGWIKVGSVRTFQPSEFAKVILIVLISKFAAQAVDDHQRVKFLDFCHIGIYVAIPLVLVMLQPDWGTAFVFVCIFMGIMFAARITYRLIFLFGLAMAGGITLAFFTIMEQYQKNRILGFLGLASDETASDVTYNVERAKQAMGSGGMFGKGFFQPGSFVQLDYLPEKHTDFIFASGIEAVGFVGGAAVILLYAVLLLRFLYLAAVAKDTLGSFIITGVIAMLFSHVFENIAMNIGVMPVTGIPLPLISYGGSNMLSNMLAFGLVFNVAMRRSQSKYSKRGGPPASYRF